MGILEYFVECTILSDEKQLLSLRVENQSAGIMVVITLVYAKCPQI